MPLTKAQKAIIIEEVKDKLSRTKAAFFVSFKGVDVKTSSALRKSVKNVQGEFKVVKKTLLARSLGDSAAAIPQQTLQGEVALAFDYASEVNVAKIVAEFTKKSSLTILGGLMENVFLEPEQVKELALLPSLDVMRSRVLGAMQSPLTGLVRTLQGINLQFINVLRAIASKNT